MTFSATAHSTSEIPPACEFFDSYGIYQHNHAMTPCVKNLSAFDHMSHGGSFGALG
jgi:hypothetical protein